jgi:hypothetical protein
MMYWSKITINPLNAKKGKCIGKSKTQFGAKNKGIKARENKALDNSNLFNLLRKRQIAKKAIKIKMRQNIETGSNIVPNNEKEKISEKTTMYN